MKKCISLVLALAMVLCWLPLGTPVHAAQQEVTLAGGGSLDSALSSVADGGTIRLSGTVSVSSLSSHNKHVTITGGELSFTQTTVTLGDHIAFDNMTLTFPSGATVYAAGYSVTIGAGVTLTNSVTIYGGKSGGTVASTDLTLLSGTYDSIYGGSKSGEVTGDTHLTVGGTVNSTIDYTNHSGTNKVYGGNYGGNIGGTAYTTFTGNAKAHYIYGGSRGTGTITGGTDITISGGSLMSIYGGGTGAHTGGAKLTITGGTMEQVFGGSGGAMTGDVELNVLGGTITRRIYGGCYNEVSGTGFWSTSYYVTGTIVLTIGGGANITFSSSNNDRAIYAHSRQKTLSSTEVTHLVFADSTAYNTYKNKVKAQDLAMKLIMMSVSAADYTHYRSYAASGDTITQSCICGGCSATAKLTVSGAPFSYTGSAIKPASLVYSADWHGGDLDITYANNVAVGTATATAKKDSASASVTFAIEKAALAAPSVTAVAETVKGKADGKLVGLTTAMELSTDGVTFAPVTDVDASFAPGTYYVRIPGSDNYNPSPATAVTVAEGRMLTVTFLADGNEVATREVAWNGSVTDIPQIPAKAGHDQTAPKWNKSLTGITTDTTVEAVYTINHYTVTFLADGNEVAKREVEWNGSVTDIPAIPTKAGHDQTAPKWNKSLTGITADTTVEAVYTINRYTVTFMADGKEVATREVEWNGSVTDVPAVPAKTGYDQTAPKWNKSLSNITANTTVEAVYTINCYTVVFQLADGTELSKQTYTHGQSVTVPKAPEAPENMAFFGWDREVTACTSDAVYTAVFVSTVVKGDVNGDGGVDNKDVIYLLWNRLFGGDVYPLTASADVDGSGEADNADVIYLLYYTIFGESEYPLH